MKTYTEFMIEVARVLALTYKMADMKFKWCWKSAWANGCSAIEAVEIYEEQMAHDEENYKGYNNV